MLASCTSTCRIMPVVSTVPLALAAFDFFASIVATNPSLLRRLHRLTVDDGRAGSRLAPLFLAHPFAQGGVHALPDPGVAPGAEVAPHRGPRRKLMRQGSPLASRAVQVQNGIDHFTHLGGSGVFPWLGRGDQRFQDPPLVVAHIDFDSFFAASSHLFSSLVPF